MLDGTSGIGNEAAFAVGNVLESNGPTVEYFWVLISYLD